MNNTDVENTFLEIEEAYKILTDPLLRPIYDNYGKVGIKALRTFSVLKLYMDDFYEE